jgi:hypothetical protein
VERLLATLRRDAGSDSPARSFLDYVLLDREAGSYPGGIDPEGLLDMGVELLDLPLITPASAPGLDPERLSRVLVSLV